MFDDLEFDNTLDNDCHFCESDARYCYIHHYEAAMTHHAMSYWRKIRDARSDYMMDDIRTKRLAKLLDMAHQLQSLEGDATRLLAAAETDDEKLTELREKVISASRHASYCWQEEKRQREGV